MVVAVGSKRSGLRIRGRVKNRKDTRAEKMTVSGELMPALTPYFSKFTHCTHCALSQWKAGGYMLPVFFIA